MKFPTKHFGLEIRQRREASGLTLEQLAERSGLTPNYIGGVEIGKRDPSLSILMALAVGLSISPAELFEQSPDLTLASMEAGQLFGEDPALELASRFLMELMSRGDGPPYRGAAALRTGAQLAVPFHRLKEQYPVIHRKRR